MRSAASIRAPTERAVRQNHRPMRTSAPTTTAATPRLIHGAGAFPAMIEAISEASAATRTTTIERPTNAARRKRRPRGPNAELGGPNGGPERPGPNGGGPGGPCRRCALRWPPSAASVSVIREPVSDPVHRQDVSRPGHVGLDLLPEVLHVRIDGSFVRLDAEAVQ